MAPNDPFNQLEQLFEQMRRSMQTGDPFATLPQLEGDTRTDLQSWQRDDMNLTAEPVDDGYVITADLPGFEKDEIELRFEDKILSIRGTHDSSEETTEEGRTTRRREQRHAHEQVRLPGAIDEQAISASYRNGVLEVHLPTLSDSDEEDSSRIDID